MKRFSHRLLASIVLVGIVLSAPFWVPAIQALAAQTAFAAPLAANPNDSSLFYMFDAGYFTGDDTQTVVASPQVFAWSVNHEGAHWSVETGFLMGSLLDAEGGRIFITEQRNVEHESLTGLVYAADSTYPPGETWPVFLTVLDSNTGKVLSRDSLLDLQVDQNGYYLYPLGVNGNRLYLSNYSSFRNLLIYDLETGTANYDFWNLCEQGYVMQTLYLPEVDSVAALCDQGLTLTDMQTGEQRSVKIPQMGSEEFETGNGLFVANGTLHVIDTNGGTMYTVNPSSMQLSTVIDYHANLQEREADIWERALAWIGEQIAGSASAKRWMALTAVSPDGRWLAVDGGIASGNTFQRVLLVDLQGRQDTQVFKLGGSPSRLAFGANGDLLVVFEGYANGTSARGALLDLSTGESAPVTIGIRGWLQNLIAGG